jgi:hypothetical protein
LDDKTLGILRDETWPEERGTLINIGNFSGSLVYSPTIQGKDLLLVDDPRTTKIRIY